MIALNLVESTTELQVISNIDGDEEHRTWPRNALSVLYELKAQSHQCNV